MADHREPRRHDVFSSQARADCYRMAVVLALGAVLGTCLTTSATTAVTLVAMSLPVLMTAAALPWMLHRGA